MKKVIFSIIFSFFFCLILKVLHLWFFFTPFYFMMEGRKISENAMWEIPMGTLMLEIALSFSGEYSGVLLKSMLILTAAVISSVNPKKLFVFFPAAAFSLFLSDGYGAAVMAACLWCGVSRAIKLLQNKNKSILT